jgi:hypothetical protein
MSARLFAIALLFVAALPADEGMWTFDNPPTGVLKSRYGFEPSRAWLDHLRLASARLSDGGSGSFVSSKGLLLTNHHVAAPQLQNLSSEKKDYMSDGFYAATMADEKKSPDLEVNVLISTEDVTARVMSAVKPGQSDEDALKARRAAIADITRESQKATGLRSDVVTLYNGGEYWLYRYKKYNDVRLVFAPERQIAFFGGDSDNFTYPRYDLDMALYRVYDNGKPLETRDYLKWNSKGAATGELVFVSGHPGSTSRLDTMAQLEATRDEYAKVITSLRNRLDVLERYSKQGPEQARQASEEIFGLQNSFKAIDGTYQGLLDKNLIARKQKEEEEFRALVKANPEWNRQFGGAWDAIAAAEAKAAPRRNQQLFRPFDSRMYQFALQIVRYVAEVKKPDGQRMPGFHESQLESLRYNLLSPAPIYPGLEAATLAGSLERAKANLPPDDPYVTIPLSGRTPEEAAKALVDGSKISDPAVRKALIEGGSDAVAASTDSMIVLARKLDPFGREMFHWFEDNVNSILTKAGEQIGKARFLAYGHSAYPDATFTLRLSFGTVKGYPMNGTMAPPKTTFFGLYDRAAGFDFSGAWALPSRWLENRAKLDLSTPYNFAATTDIIGGNSGSPVVNRNGELVGLIFDGNIESLPGEFIYDEQKNRAVAVHTAAMMTALRKMYGADALADELEGVQR